MRNKILIDHVLIAVSDEEFSKFIELCNTNSKLVYKKIEDKNWSWEAIYVGLSSKIYLEIVLKSKYPSTIGLALSSLGEENGLLKDLALKYPGREFEKENAQKENVPWYNAYFSKEMESETSFLWFMEYLGEFKNTRQDITKSKLPEILETININLSGEEVNDFTKRANECGLQVVEEQQKIAIKDREGRGFFLSTLPETNLRVIHNF